ncbi:unnamed protein product [Pleuronectes platessa]|uniref:Uncharacterized protein n=1 Tax=Pleuronectes platessa TaxID=8262 RepID=A0A9N7TN11_PLEPL|nr:unnamed protein product [Pleuronectes platessa]
MQKSQTAMKNQIKRVPAPGPGLHSLEQSLLSSPEWPTVSPSPWPPRAPPTSRRGNDPLNCVGASRDLLSIIPPPGAHHPGLLRRRKVPPRPRSLVPSLVQCRRFFRVF